MEKLNVKNYQISAGVLLVLIGILLLTVLSGPIRFLGIIFIIIAVVFVASIFYSKLDNPENGRSKSRIRDQILRHQYKK